MDAKYDINMLRWVVHCCLEEDLAGQHLVEDAPGGPDVDLGAVGLRAHQQLWRVIPDRDHIACVAGHRVGVVGWLREPEVGELDNVRWCQKDVHRLQIAMHPTILSECKQRQEDLWHGAGDPDISKWRSDEQHRQIVLAVIKDQIDPIIEVASDNLPEADNVFVHNAPK